jgi:pimeloyl-ACP methyl ester carboxylesterase
MQSPTSLEKRTNVRIKSWPLRAVRAGLLALEAGSPELAAHVGEHLMFRTTRRHPHRAERELLARGRRFVVRDGGSRVVGWSFGEGPVVMLVHGWNGRGGQLGSFVDPLVAAGFRAVIFDAPGHGESEGSSSSLVEFANAFDAVLDVVRPTFGPAHAVIAHSMGAPSVIHAMSRFQRADATSQERGLRELGLPVGRFALIAPPIDVRDFVRVFSRIVGFGDSTREELGRRVEARFDVRLEDLYAPAVARTLRAPVLVVHDEDDAEVPLRCGRLLAESWPGAELDVTRGLGHTKILRDPGVVDRIVRFVTA